MRAELRCRVCERTQPLAPIAACPDCDGPLDVGYGLETVVTRRERRSMWRYEDLLPHAAPTDPGTPGMTPLVPAPRLSRALGVELLLKLESANPTHSFKDRIAATAISAAHAFGLQTLCCASTGNLGEAVAARAAANGMEAVVLVPSDHLEVAPTASYGARVLAVDGSFDDCRRLEERARGAVSLGLPRRQPAGGRLGGREDDRLRDRRAARRDYAGRRRSRRSPRACSSRSSRRGSPRQRPSAWPRAVRRGSSARRPPAARRSRQPGPTTGRSRASARRPRCARSPSATRSSATSPSVRRACRAARSAPCPRTRSPTAPRSSPRRRGSSPTRPAASRSARSSG